MKKTIMKSALLALMMLTTTETEAQTRWQYSYDATGNRTQRVVTTGSSARKKSVSEYLIDEGRIKAIGTNNRNGIKIEIVGYGSEDMAEVSVYDLSGKQLLYKRIESEMTTLNLSDLRRSTYILAIELNGETRSTKFNK